VLKDSNKVVIEQNGGQGVVPYLPLPALEPNKTPAPAPAPAATGGAQ
jgi:membrane protease subunit HflK